MQSLQPIDETSYLSVPNAVLYRRIMRAFYREYEKMRVKLYKEDVYALLKEEAEFEGLFPDYSLIQLELDLQALTRWKNLTAIQDPGRVYTIADYKNKQYTYCMTENAVEIERMTVRLENLYLESGSLSSNFLVRLEQSLSRTGEMTASSLKEVYEWWSLLQEDFRRLIQNYQDYLRDFYSGHADRLMKSVEFVLHKDKFVQYLNEFVQELQRHAVRIGTLLRSIDPQMEQKLLERVAQSELEIPHVNAGQYSPGEEQIRENVRGRWISLRDWFLDSPERGAEYAKVLQITNDIIRSMIQNAAMIVQMQNWGISRREDYRKFLALFLNCPSLEEAHCLSAHVFGIQQVQHFRTREPREGDSVNRSVYEEDAAGVLLKPHTRSYREKKDRRGFTDRSFEKMLQRQQYLDRTRSQREIAERYIRNGKIDFAAIRETVPEATRALFLQWIAAANLNRSRRARTEFGWEYRLRRGKGSCTLLCEDGALQMPAYVIEFIGMEGDGDGKHE